MQVDEIGMDDFERRKLRQKKAWEEVENGLAIIYPGAVGKDKQVKLTILSALTGSTSETKIQQLPPDQLENMALAIRDFGKDVLAGLVIETPAAYIKSLYVKYATDPPEREAAGTESTPSDHVPPQASDSGSGPTEDPAEPYRAKLRTCEQSVAALNATYHAIPETIRQDCHEQYTKQLRAVGKKR